MQALEVVLFRASSRRYRSLLQRADGVTVAVDGGAPHDTERSREILKGAAEQLNQAEILTRAVCDLAIEGRVDLRALRAATGDRWWSPSATEAALVAAFGRLREAAGRWAELGPGGSLSSSRRRG